MGAGASTYQQTDLEKPADGSDITELTQAQEEITRLQTDYASHFPETYIAVDVAAIATLEDAITAVVTARAILRDEVEKNEAAHKVQQAQRTKIAVKRVEEKREEKRQDEAATKVQCAQRKKAAISLVESKKEEKLKNEEQNNAATKLQTVQRGKAAKARVEAVRASKAADGSETKDEGGDAKVEEGETA